MAEYSRLASGQVTSVLTGAPTSVILPFTPDFIEISNSTRAAAASGVTRAWWETDMGQGAAFVVTTGAGPADGTSFISAATGGGFSTFKGGLSQQFGASLPIASITKNAGAPIVTTTGNHGLVSGNVVIFQNLYQSSTTGMQQIAGIPFVVTVTGATTFTIPFDNSGSNYTALSGSPTNPTPTVKQVLYPNLFAPSVGFISALTLSSSTIVKTTAPSNIQVGQEVAFRIPSSWGTTQLNSLPNTIIPGSPIYGYVTSVTNSLTFVVNINSTGYTAYNANQVFASFPGENFPQVVPVGDVNSGGYPYTGAQLYPSPAFYNGTGTGTVLSVNGPSIQGAFANNSSMGFIIGGSISGTTADTIFWRAYLHDMNV
jgi:hypothetical protein